MKYTVKLVYYAEYCGYVADVAELPGCMSQGKSIQAALENVKDAIRDYRAAEGSDAADEHSRAPSAN